MEYSEANTKSKVGLCTQTLKDVQGIDVEQSVKHETILFLQQKQTQSYNVSVGRAGSQSHFPTPKVSCWLLLQGDGRWICIRSGLGARVFPFENAQPSSEQNGKPGKDFMDLDCCAPGPTRWVWPQAGPVPSFVHGKESWAQGFKKVPSSSDVVQAPVPCLRCVSDHDREGHQDDNGDVIERGDISRN